MGMLNLALENGGPPPQAENLENPARKETTCLIPNACTSRRFGLDPNSSLRLETARRASGDVARGLTGDLGWGILVLRAAWRENLENPASKEILLIPNQR